MKSTLSVEMPSDSVAKAAVVTMGAAAVRGKAQVKCVARGSVFEATVQAESFASLRAGTTSLLRDLKVFLDSAKAVGVAQPKK